MMDKGHFMKTIVARAMQCLLKSKGSINLQFLDLTSDHHFSLFEKYALEGNNYGARVRAHTRLEIEKLFQGARIRILEYSKENENVFVAGTKEGEHMEEKPTQPRKGRR
jgi:hypothetical protein